MCTWKIVNKVNYQQMAVTVHLMFQEELLHTFLGDSYGCQHIPNHQT